MITSALEKTEDNNFKTNHSDRAGVVLSIACLIHCLLLPAVVPLLPFVAFVENESLHIALASILSCVAVYSFFHGYKKHKQLFILIVGAIGASLLFSALLFHENFHGHESLISVEAIITSFGGVLLIAAHLLNIKHCRCSFTKPSCSC